MNARVPYLERVSIIDDRVGDWSRFPYSLPFVKGLSLGLMKPVTFLAGENWNIDAPRRLRQLTSAAA